MQFSFAAPILLRVTRVHTDWSTYEGWIWLDGYELDESGDAVERRSVFVQIAGLRLAQPNAGPASARQRNSATGKVVRQPMGNAVERRLSGSPRVPQNR